MAKNLSQMSWDEVQEQMSIAGNPAKIAQLGRQIEGVIGLSLDESNRAELINVELMLRRLVAEIKLYQRMYDKSH